MYYELCGMFSRSFGKKNAILLCGIMFLFFVRYVNNRFMHECVYAILYIYYIPGFIKHGQISVET